MTANGRWIFESSPCQDGTTRYEGLKLSDAVFNETPAFDPKRTLQDTQLELFDYGQVRPDCSGEAPTGSGGALRRQLLELNDKCIGNYVIALDLMRQIIEKRKELAKRYPWLAADV